MSETKQKEPEKLIANALWFRCGKWIDCRTNDLEEAAERIVSELQDGGYRIVFAPHIKSQDETAQRRQSTSDAAD